MDGEIQVEAIPVAHWGARMMRDTHRGYNGYVLEREGRRCVSPVTPRTRTRFAKLRRRPRPLDLAIVPIGAYDPWIRAHCTPEQAAAMAAQAGAEHFVPVHHQTFKLSSEPMDEPAARIRAAFAREPHRLLAVNVGETFRVPGSTTRSTGRQRIWSRVFFGDAETHGLRSTDFPEEDLTTRRSPPDRYRALSKP